MLLRFNFLFISFCLLLVGNVWADSPDIIIVPEDEPGAVILYFGNANAPPPLVIVNGVPVKESAYVSGPPDCSKAENRPICQSVQFAMDANPCEGPPAVITVKASHVYIRCGLIGQQPPDVWINGHCVNCN